MRNNKGFSLVEILAVMVILGILITLGLATYTRYQKKAVNQSYDILRENASHAAENYFMDHEFASEVTIEELVDKNYLENNSDPMYNGKKCTGDVKKMSTTAESNGTLSKESYKVALICEKHESCQIYPDTLGCDAQDGIVTDGTETYYNMGLAGYNFGNSIAFAIRVKFNKLTEGHYVEYFGNWENAGGGLGLTIDDKFYFNLYSTTAGYIAFTSDKVAYANHWYVVVGTLRDGKLFLYIDGDPVTTSTGATSVDFTGGYIQPSPYGVMVGGNPGSSGVYFNAAITVSDAIVFDDSLDQSDIDNYFRTPNMRFNYNGTKRVASKKSF